MQNIVDIRQKQDYTESNKNTGGTDEKSETKVRSNGKRALPD